MPSLTERGLRMLAELAPRHGGGKIVYEWDGQRCVIDEAAFGETTFSVEEEGGTRYVKSDRDFLFAAEKLVIAGRRAVPRRGARITIVHDEGLHNEVFEVLAPGGADVYQPCDPYGIMIRVHTKRLRKND